MLVGNAAGQPENWWMNGNFWRKKLLVKHWISNILIRLKLQFCLFHVCNGYICKDVNICGCGGIGFKTSVSEAK